MGKFIDLTGQKFGQLTVLSRAENDGGRVRWNCQCDCGKITIVRGDHLRTGHTKTCGCIITTNLTGKRFGKLVALEPTDRRYFTSVVWKCQCDCGNITYVDACSLQRENTQSCGCINSSLGEQKIREILFDNNINYQSEYSFNDLKDKQKLKFDFAIFDDNNNLHYLIEFDGIQHYYYRDSGTTWNTLSNFQQTKKHDQMKNDYCEEHNIPLIRIPYWKRNTLTIDDLNLETSNYKI